MKSSYRWELQTNVRSHDCKSALMYSCIKQLQTELSAVHVLQCESVLWLHAQFLTGIPSPIVNHQEKERKKIRPNSHYTLPDVKLIDINQGCQVKQNSSLKCSRVEHLCKR